MENSQAVNLNKQAAIYGVLVGIIYIILTTVAQQFFMTSYFSFYAAKILFFILYLVLLGLFAAQLRKASGGYISFRDVFRYLFIMIIISELFYFVYLYIYVFYIDPNFLDKMKAMTLSFMENQHVPQEKMDQVAAQFDKQVEESKHFSLGKNLLSFFSYVVLDSLFGLIIATIVKKKQPVSFDTAA